MDLLQFTTYDEIRSLLGVSGRELKDAVLALPHWTLEVEQRILDIDGGAGAVLTQFATVYAISYGARTAAQTQFFKVTCMYVLYAMGQQLVQRADSFSPVEMTDGKAGAKHLADRFQLLAPVLDGGAQRLRERLKDALLILVPTASIAAALERTMIVGAGLGTDPVTGT